MSDWAGIAWLFVLLLVNAFFVAAEVAEGGDHGGHRALSVTRTEPEANETHALELKPTKAAIGHSVAAADEVDGGVVRRAGCRCGR